MKINVTCAGCEVTVEEVDGKCVVVAMQDGEVVEEFTIDCEEKEEGSEEIEDLDVEDLDAEDTEEVEDVDSDEMEEDEDEDEDEMNESVKSFGEFLKG